MLSDALALMGTVPVTVAPSAGTKICTVGGVVSSAVLTSAKSSTVTKPVDRIDIATEMAVAPVGTAGSVQLAFV